MRFSKMHGAGNDFVVLDLRNGKPALTPDACARIADRLGWRAGIPLAKGVADLATPGT